MALPIILPSDFKGFYKIAANSYKSELLQDYIDQFQKKYVRDIIGDVAYLAAKGTNKTKWTDLFGGADYVDNYGKNRHSDGLQDSLKGFIYFEFTRDNFVSSNNGAAKNTSENSTPLTAIEISTIAASRFNISVDNLKSDIYIFLTEHDVISQDIASFIDNANQTYNITIADTKYLDANDEVAIDGDYYDIVSIVDATTFVINAGSTGYIFDGAVKWYPYEDVEFDSFSYITL